MQTCLFFTGEYALHRIKMGSKDNICHLVTRVNQYEKNTEKMNMLKTDQVKGVLTTTTIITQNCLQILPDS